MRSFASPGLLLLVAALVVGCDTDQPLVITDQNIDLEIIAPGATVAQYNVWNLAEDTVAPFGEPDDVNDDGMPDDTLWCEAAGSGPASSVPWTYSLQVSVLKAGEVVAVPISTPDALEDGTNMAGYDEFVGSGGNLKNDSFVTHDRGACSGNTNIICNPNAQSTFCDDNGAGSCQAAMNCSDDFSVLCNDDSDCVGIGSCISTITRRYVWDDVTRRRLTSASRELLLADTNGLYDACFHAMDMAGCTGLPAIPAGTVLGLCPGDDLGEPRIDGNEDPAVFSVNLEKGDTIIVEAKRFDTLPSGINFSSQPSIRASIFVDGILLQDDEVVGDLGSAADSESAISFFFTSK